MHRFEIVKGCQGEKKLAFDAGFIAGVVRNVNQCL